jgi:RNase P/RNase MRP subunit p29
VTRDDDKNNKVGYDGIVMKETRNTYRIFMGTWKTEKKLGTY